MNSNPSRRDFLSVVIGCTLAPLVLTPPSGAGASNTRPNVILCMADDQGWGDTAYNGHPVLKTPNLDSMAANGIRFDRFYSGAPVCSPTRGSCLTGRHPFRYGIFSANVGHMPGEEKTLAEVLRSLGYATGHFGKWHLGTLTTEIEDSNRGGPDGADHYSPPWENGFDVCFSTEAKVPTWNPMITPDPSAGGVRNETPGEPFGTYYWTGPGERAEENLAGDDSRVIMDRAIPFIREAIKRDVPFFAVIWFHAPHLPAVAGERYRSMYDGYSEDERHFWGCITALDEQVGRLRKELRSLGIENDTMLWYTSDNGPEGKSAEGRTRGTTGPFRGRKRSLHEGGVRVPGILEWPAVVKTPRVVTAPCSTLDYGLTVLDALGLSPDRLGSPIDGISLMPLIVGKTTSRPSPIAFESGKQWSLSDNRYKLITTDGGETYMLYDIVDDPGEKNDLIAEKPNIADAMKETLETWRVSCDRSRGGADYR